MKREYDIVVIGAGVMGASVARSFAYREPRARIAVIEKEPRPAMHTSGRNSGVVHSGFNPAPGSLKAQFCVEGNRQMTEFCLDKKIPFESCGTLVVANQNSEMGTLEELLRRGRENGVPGIKIIDGDKLRSMEPNAHGIAALHSPTGAITDGSLVTGALVEEAKIRGCDFLFNERVNNIIDVSGKVRVETRAGPVFCERLVNCAGFYSDEIAHKAGLGLSYVIIPFRGDYLRMRSTKRRIVNSMIYPVPDLRYPFLGVHWTKTVSGEVIIGPNAVLAFGRESYSFFEVEWAWLARTLFGKNFRRLIKSSDFRKAALIQLRLSFSRKTFVEEARKLIANVSVEDFEKGKSGIRPQLVSEKGELVEDILIERKGGQLHVLNAVSPGFTCALPFADTIVGMF